MLQISLPLRWRVALRVSTDQPGGMKSPTRQLPAADETGKGGEEPMPIVWRLRRPMPSDLFLDAKVVAG